MENDIKKFEYIYYEKVFVICFTKSTELSSQIESLLDKIGK